MRPDDPTAFRALREGADTSEKHVADGGAGWGRLLAWLGITTAAGSALAEAMGAETITGAILGGTVAILGIVTETAHRVAYIRSRERIKSSAVSTKGAP